MLVVLRGAYRELVGRAWELMWGDSTEVERYFPSSVAFAE